MRIRRSYLPVFLSVGIIAGVAAAAVLIIATTTTTLTVAGADIVIEDGDDTFSTVNVIDDGQSATISHEVYRGAITNVTDVANITNRASTGTNCHDITVKFSGLTYTGTGNINDIQNLTIILSNATIAGDYLNYGAGNGNITDQSYTLCGQQQLILGTYTDLSGAATNGDTIEFDIQVDTTS